MAKKSYIFIRCAKVGYLYGCLVILFCLVLQPELTPMSNSYYESLPKHCPPTGAEHANGDGFYRLVERNPAIERDFHSHKKLGIWPAQFRKHSECEACSISIWTSPVDCENLKKLPKNRNKTIAKIVLNPPDGVLMQTSSPNHRSWWMADTFIIINAITYL